MNRGGAASAAGTEQAAEAEGSAVYVYAVVPAAPAEGLGTGVGTRPAPVRVVGGPGAAAVVSDVPAGWRSAGRTDVEAHDRVLGELVAQGTVVPLRFGVVMDSDDEVRERLLERHGGALAALLERLDGRVQMTVKAYYVEEALLREVVRRQPELKRRSDALEGVPPAASQPERLALGRAVAAAVEEQRAVDERTLVEPLAAAAEEVRVGAPASERQVAVAHLLVDRRERARVDAVVTRLSEEHRDRFALRYVGPLAPYSFSDLALEED